MERERLVRLGVSFIFGVLLLGLFLIALASSVTGEEGRLSVNARPRPMLPGRVCAQDLYTLCVYIYTGTLQSTFVISNPGGVSGFKEYHLVNFDQRVVNRSSTAVEVEVISRQDVDTRAPYPVGEADLPADIRKYLQPEPHWI